MVPTLGPLPSACALPAASRNALSVPALKMCARCPLGLVTAAIFCTSSPADMEQDGDERRMRGTPAPARVPALLPERGHAARRARRPCRPAPAPTDALRVPMQSMLMSTGAPLSASPRSWLL